MLIPTGFWSYTTSDETNSRGKLSQLRALLSAELQQQVGRAPKVNIFQDVVAIPPGEEWDAQIRKAIGESSFIIPIVTPGFLQSEWCCREVTLFRAREADFGVSNLVFPLHYVSVDHIGGGDASECQDPEVLAFLRTRQWTDFRPLRLRNQEGEDVAILLESLAQGILRALREAGVEQERAATRRRQAEAEEQRSAQQAQAAREREALAERVREDMARTHRQAEEARRAEAERTAAGRQEEEEVEAAKGAEEQRRAEEARAVREHEAARLRLGAEQQRRPGWPRPDQVTAGVGGNGRRDLEPTEDDAELRRLEQAWATRERKWAVRERESAARRALVADRRRPAHDSKPQSQPVLERRQSVGDRVQRAASLAWQDVYFRTCLCISALMLAGMILMVITGIK